MHRRLTHAHARPHASEDGMVLPLALIAVMVLAAQAAALLALGSSDVQIAANHLHSTQALFVAEAGIEDAFNALRAPGALAAAPSVPTPVPGLAGPGPTFASLGTYDVVYHSAGPNTARVIATATLPSGSKRVLRATITTHFAATSGVLANGALTLDGTTSVLGRCGAVHANSSLDVANSLVEIQGAASAGGGASGSYHAPGASVLLSPVANQPRVAMPSISAARLLAAAENDPTASAALYQLTRDGAVMKWNVTTRVFELVEDQQTVASNRTILHGTGPGWEWSRATVDLPAQWRIADSVAPPGTFYVEGDVIISGSPGAAPASSWTATLIAADVQPSSATARGGNVVVSGNPRLVWHLPDVVIAADRDIAITGIPGGNYTGLLVAHEQVAITGAAVISGAVVAEDAEGLSNTIVGSGARVAGSTITYDCGMIAPLETPLSIVAWGW